MSRATSAAGITTKRRNDIRGCGTTRPDTLMTCSPYMSRSRSSVRGAHRWPSVRPRLLSICLRTDKRASGGRSVSSRMAPLRNPGWPAGPPIGRVACQPLLVTQPMPSVASNIATARLSVRHRSPTFDPRAIRHVGIASTQAAMVRRCTDKTRLPCGQKRAADATYRLLPLFPLTPNAKKPQPGPEKVGGDIPAPTQAADRRSVQSSPPNLRKNRKLAHRVRVHQTNQTERLFCCENRRCQVAFCAIL